MADYYKNCQMTLFYDMVFRNIHLHSDYMDIPPHLVHFLPHIPWPHYQSRKYMNHMHHHYMDYFHLRACFRSWFYLLKLRASIETFPTISPRHMNVSNKNILVLFSLFFSVHYTKCTLSKCKKFILTRIYCNRSDKSNSFFDCICYKFAV